MAKERLKALIVDDEVEICALLSKYLAKEGYETVIANTGEEAVEIAWKIRPDVILLDVVMPGMTGVEAFRRIKELNIKSVVIMITASDDRIKGVGEIKSDLDGYLSKPILLTDLKLVIDKALELC